MGNWRPISAIIVDAKIDSKVIVTRLQKVLPEIIHFKGEDLDSRMSVCRQVVCFKVRGLKQRMF